MVFLKSEWNQFMLLFRMLTCVPPGPQNNIQILSLSSSVSIFSTPLTSHSQYHPLCSMCSSDLLSISKSVHLPLRVSSLPSLPGELLLILRYLAQGHLFLGSLYAFPTPTSILLLPYSPMSLFCTKLFCNECPVCLQLFANKSW